MNRPEYFKLSRESERYSDEFYKCVSDWLNSKSGGTPPVDCTDIAEKYRRALMDELTYLQTRATGERRHERIKRCEAYLKYVESQMALLRTDSDH